MRSIPSPRNFRSGELAPWLDGISNDATQSGCRTLENWIVLKQGAARRRPGTFYAGEVKDSADATILVPVEIDTSNIYVLEIGDVYIRVWDQSTHARTGSSYEITSPWSTGELADLRWQYVPDEKALYWVHPKHAMRKLAFTSAASWTLGVENCFPFTEFMALSRDRGSHVTYDMKNWYRKSINMVSAGRLYIMDAVKSKNVYIAVPGYPNEVSKRVVISDDGENWVDTTPSEWDDDGLVNACALAADPWGNVALVWTSAGSGTNRIHFSRDSGLTWIPQTAPVSTADYSQIAFDPVTKGFRAITDSATGGAYSPDGASWASCPDVASGTYYAMAAHNDLWIAVKDHTIFTAFSIEGAWTVTLSDSTANTIHDVAYGNPGGVDLWVALGNPKIYNSSNGISWSSVATIDNAFRVAWIANKFHAFGAYGTRWDSTDGATWTTVTEASFDAHADHGIYSIAYDCADGVETFSSADHYAKNAVFHEGRLITGPTIDKPSTVWGSRVGVFANFGIGELANQAWSYDLAGDRNVDIQWIMGGNQLVVGTRTGEGILVGSQDEGITPSAARFVWLSTFGSKSIQPVRIHDYIVFVQRGGEIVRALVPSAGNQAWQSPDLTSNADHIALGGVVQLAHQDDPQTILYAVRDDGQLLALTFHPPNTVGWSRIVTDGEVESIAVVPTGGAEDEVWAIVKRTIGATTKRFIEYFDTLAVASKEDAHYVDCGVETANSVSFATMGGLTHLAGEIVDVLIDGNEVLTGFTVAGAGTIAFTAGYSGTHCHAGLPYTSKLQTMRMDYGSPWGAGSGLNKRTNDILLWVHNSMGGLMGPTYTLATEAVLALGSTTELTTDVEKVNFPGQWDRDGYIWIVQTKPLPFTVVAMTPNVETGAH